MRRLACLLYTSTDELPGPEIAARRQLTSHDVWGFLDSHETTGISPDMYAEFVFPYYKRIAEQYGMLSYGCCEAVAPIWDKCLHAMPNLRKVSISPWCNEELMGEDVYKRQAYSCRRLSSARRPRKTKAPQRMPQRTYSLTPLTPLPLRTAIAGLLPRAARSNKSLSLIHI